MDLLEGGNLNNYQDILDFDFYEGRGFCSYRGKYYIILIEFFNKHGNEMNFLMKRLADLATKEGLDFPQSFNSDARFFLCTAKGTPYDGSKNYSRCYFNTIEEVVNTMKGKLNEGIKSKIKLGLRELADAKKYTKWNPDTHPNAYQLDVFLRKSGYRLVDIVDHQGDTPELILEATKIGHLHPDITHNISDKTFYINIKKYGEMNVSDVEEIIKGYQTAMYVVKHIESLDLSKLEYDKETKDE